MGRRAKILGINVSIDTVSFSSIRTRSNVFLSGDLGDYEFRSFIDTVKKGRKEKAKKPKNKEKGGRYKLRHIYRHKRTQNRLTVYTKRKKPSILIPSVYMTFGSSFRHHLRYEEVKNVLRILGKAFATEFRPSEAHIAVDFISAKVSGLHDELLRSLYSPKKRSIRRFGRTLTMGSSNSSTQVEGYDKARQLKKKKKVILSVDVSRIETRLKITKLLNFSQSLEDLGELDWSPLVAKHITFLKPNRRLKRLLGDEASTSSIRKLKKMAAKHGVTSNFFRDYLAEDKRFSRAVIRALAAYRWNPVSKKV
jgi:hypothetical protein